MNGITSPPLNQSTTFTLDVVQSQSDGSRTIVATQSTPVQIQIPTIVSGQNSIQTLYLSGWVVKLNWVAANASKCKVSLDDQVLDDDAPLDTWETGYFLGIPSAGSHQVSVTAVGEPGSPPATYTFSEFTTISPVVVALGRTPAKIAITPDGTLALVSIFYGNSVAVIDITRGPAESSTIPVGNSPNSIAITPDGTLALVANQNVNSVTVIDIASGTAEAQTIAVGGSPQGIAITPDGTPTAGLALVVRGQSVTVIDIAGRTAESSTIPVGDRPTNIAITPDGTLALVGNNGDNSVTVIDIANKAAVGTIPVGNSPVDIAITPDGTPTAGLALVVNWLDNSVTVIDIAGRTAESSTIPVNSGPTAIAITPDGSLALVVSGYNNDLTVIDIANRALACSVPIGTVFVAIAITRDGLHSLIVNNSSNSVSVF